MTVRGRTVQQAARRPLMCHWRSEADRNAPWDVESSFTIVVEPTEPQQPVLTATAAATVLQRKICERNARANSNAVMIQKVFRGRKQRHSRTQKSDQHPTNRPLSPVTASNATERHLQEEAARLLQKRLRHLKSNLATHVKAQQAKSSGPKYDLFLSHSWGSGGQEKARIIKVSLNKMIPSLRIFLDVDDLGEGRGMEGVDRSDVVLILLTEGYLHSTNCMRELRAVVKRKRIVVMGTQEPAGVPRRNVEARLQEAIPRIASFGLDKELSRWGHAVPTVKRLMRHLLKVPPVEFHSVNQADMGIILLREVAQLPLPAARPPTNIRAWRADAEAAAPPAGATRRLRKPPVRIGPQHRGAAALRGTERSHIGCRAVGKAVMSMRKSTQTHCSRALFSGQNAGADDVARPTSDRPLRSSPDSTLGAMRGCEQMLVYLSADTWTSGPASAALCREVMDAMTLGLRLLLVHETPSWDNSRPQACPFETFFECARGSTPHWCCCTQAFTIPLRRRSTASRCVRLAWSNWLARSAGAMLPCASRTSTFVRWRERCSTT